MIHRYFQITRHNGDKPEVISEWFDDFGFWKYKTLPFKLKRYVAGQMWHVMAEFDISDNLHQNTIDRIVDGGKLWHPVSLADVLNRIDLRKPAMSKKRR